MNLLSFFNRRPSAPVARDRLQILLAHERSAVGSGGGNSDLVALLREEILKVIAKHVPIDSDKVQVKMDRGTAVSTLEVDIEIPTQAAQRAAEQKTAEAKTAEAKAGESKADAEKAKPEAQSAAA